MIGEGRFVVERMIATGQKLLAGLGSGTSAEELTALGKGAFPVLNLTRGEISALAGYDFHRGMLAAAQIPPERSVSDYLTENKPTDLLILMPDPNIPENIGSVCRSASALGAGALILPPKGPFPYSRRVLRSSMGTVLTLPILTLEGTPDTDIKALKKAGYKLCGTSLDPRAVNLPEYKRPDKCVLLLGNEAFGLSSDWNLACDDLVTLPMANGTDSLNVAAAAAVFLYGLIQSHGTRP
jgi:tRNA G18 (ribose-2'-O)-methylase SpoU